VSQDYNSELAPTRRAVLERLFAEARRYYEKANVIDYAADRARFIASGEIALAGRESRLNIRRTIETAVITQSIAQALGERNWDQVKSKVTTAAVRSYDRLRHLLHELIGRFRARVVPEPPQPDSTWAPTYR